MQFFVWCDSSAGMIYDYIDTELSASLKLPLKAKRWIDDDKSSWTAGSQ